MLPPPPELALINSDAMLLTNTEADEDVGAARESFALQHSELASLYAEVRPYRIVLCLGPRTMSWCSGRIFA